MGRDALAELRQAADSADPKLARILVATFNASASALKYEDIQAALAAGTLTPDVLDRLRDDYNRMVRESMAPAWRRMAKVGFAAASPTTARLLQRPVAFADQARLMNAWIASRGATLVANMTADNQATIRALIQRYTVLTPIAPDALGRIIRSSIGLTPREGLAVGNFRASLLRDNEAGLSEADIERRTQRYADRLHRARALRIARTETAFAFNRGQLDTVRAATADGTNDVLLVKQVLTGEDERVCPVCGGLDGKRALIDEPFRFTVGRRVVEADTAPFHPGCRCTHTLEKATAAERARQSN